MNDKTKALLQFEFRIRNAEDRVALSYVVVNEIQSLVDADQVFLLTGYDQRRFRIMGGSNATQIDRASPTIQHIEAHVHEHLPVKPDSTVRAGSSSEFSDAGLPPFFAWVPLHQPGHKGRPEGGIVLFRYRAFSDTEVALLAHVAAVVVHGIAAIRGRQYKITVPLRRRAQLTIGIALLAVFLAALVPVRLSTVGPAQVVAGSPRVITAPIAGVMEEVVVLPNQFVDIGDTLAYYRQDELIAELRLAENRKALAIAALDKAEHTSFVDVKARAQIPELEAEVTIAQAQIALAQERLSATRLVADRAGLVLIDRPDEWKGRPVQPGQQVLQIVEPRDVKLRIDLPAENLIPFQPGGPVSLALNSRPIGRLEAVVEYSDFKPHITPAGVLSLRIIARFEGADEVPEIGELGTARVYGEEVSLLYQLLRRPIVAWRQWVGA